MIEFKEFEESWGNRAGIDITPMLDMIFILLIFFLLTASIANPVVSVDLPETEISEVSGEQEIVVSIKDSGELFLNGEKRDIAALAAELSDLYESRISDEIYIESDTSVDFGYVVEIMDICRRSGASGISFLVEQKSQTE